MPDSWRRPPAAGSFSRRSLLLAGLAGTAVLAAGCSGAGGDRADAVTPAQADQLAEQVQVQADLVAAFDRALAASPELAASAVVLADQARQQLDRLRAAAPGAGASTASSSTAPASGQDGGPLASAAARAFLRSSVTKAADAHAAACPDFTGARAALLGSIAAGLRGQAEQLT